MGILGFILLCGWLAGPMISVSLFSGFLAFGFWLFFLLGHGLVLSIQLLSARQRRISSARLFLVGVSQLSLTGFAFRCSSGRASGSAAPRKDASECALVRTPHLTSIPFPSRPGFHMASIHLILAAPFSGAGSACRGMASCPTSIWGAVRRSRLR
ncbi:hypothetical protein BGZ61DRAFT_206915 [Ilyonectria robusta]|uniref:uncharacterized protein n=1 Tax=Ilyonectria robusta TaxID=1079257 RepID=UPI001E8E9100|nr:uncharacterized protein BGZ61DRAFT_206915 [Ilyonectria robusta]KAH8714160.1 hypothetical protein BGZ61DRAFT_206915 [Ilyonectria robusta]